MNAHRCLPLAVAVLVLTALPCSAQIFGKREKKSDDSSRTLPDILPDPDGKPAPMNKKVKVFILSGQSNMCGMGKVDPLKQLVQSDEKFGYLVDDNGGWTQRKDAYYLYLLMGVKLHSKGWVSATVNGQRVGPEGAIGHYLGYYLDEPVLLIKVACGNRSLGFDVMPPTSRKRTGNTDNSAKYYHGWSYDNWVKGAKDLLNNLGKHYPGYQGQGYEVAGFFWWQGHKDKGMSQDNYEVLLKELIHDFRNEFNAPKAPFVVATIGFNGMNTGAWTGVFKAQMAISDPSRHPDLAGNVASVDIRSFAGGGYHYGENGATYAKVGDAMGRAMVKLLMLNRGSSGKATDKPGRSLFGPKKPAKQPEERPAATDPSSLKAKRLLKTALEAEELGQTDMAKTLYKRIIDEYPNTEAAAKAKEQLKKP